ncbi:tetratricopeptide repeat protein [Alcaligenaceae bacterium]|nr:tetratricopeptide repeat protein [Alcaligenaceae bacterium]
MNKHREQLCPLWLSVLIGIGVLAALVTAYQRDGEQTQSLAAQPPSELSAAYLEAWLRVKPDSREYLNLLGTQYIKLQRWDSALVVAKKLGHLETDNNKARQQGLLLEIEATEQMAYQYPPQDLRRASGIKVFLNTLQQTTKYDWDVPTMRLLAEKARLLGDDTLTNRYYKKLATSDSDNAVQWYGKLATIALANQGYEEAARAYFDASSVATTRDSKRHYFINALKVLESGDQVARACEEGAQRLGDLINDPQTLSYLLTLARQANRSDLVNRYAHELVRRELLRQNHRNATSSQITFMPSVDQPGVNFWPAITGARRYFISSNATPVENISNASKLAEYELIFKAFIESNELDEAEAVAQQAMDAGFDQLVWARRLAETAQWNSHPKKAFDNWLLLARQSNDDIAWKHVLTLAPQFDDDAAYLSAWERTQVDANQAIPATLASHYALLEQYRSLGHGESALRISEIIKTQGAPKERQEMVWLEASITEQLAYKYPPDDHQRVEGLARFTQVLQESTQYDWTVLEMAWFAKKSRETGNNELVNYYYQKLAIVDVSNTAKWQEQIGDLALANQAYEAASNAYFSAQDAAVSLEDQRFYFLSGLKSLVANSQIDLACNEAEKRSGKLAQDPTTLRYLINLARQANRRDLMSRYARDLITYSDQSDSGVYYSDFRGAVGYVNSRPIELVGMLQRVATDTISTDNSAAQAAITESSDFDLAFRAFLESKQLDEAEKLAKQALDRNLDSMLWTQRLAQVAEWNRHPEVSLKYWLKYAQMSGDEQAWAKVLKSARQLNNDQAYLAALMHAAGRSPRDMALNDEIIATYERLGQPQAGMQYLKNRATGVNHQPLLERYANLAERSGNDQAALDGYRSLLSSYPTNPSYAMHVASYEYKQGNLNEALNTLRQVREQAGDHPESAPYWRLYAELSRQAQHNQDANFAYQHLLATGQSSSNDLNSMTDFYQAYPIDAARTAELQFQKSESQAALRASLQYYVEARAWSRVRTLLDAMSPEQLEQFERSGISLAARAQYYLHVQRWDDALADLRRAVQLPDTDDDTKALYIWTLVEFGTDAELKAVLSKWRSAAKVNSSYWGAFAAGELRLGNAARAVMYLQEMRVQSGNDPLWLMALADAQEASGHADEAWGLRRQAWNILQKKSAAGELDEVATVPGTIATLDASERQDLRMAGVTLSPTFTNGDISRSLLIDLLKKEGRNSEQYAVANSLLGDNPGLPTIKEVSAPDPLLSPERQNAISTAASQVALAWAMSGEHIELARAWLAKEYLHHALNTLDAQMTVALADNDKAKLNELLDSGQGGASIETRIDALLRTGRGSEAETLAFAAAEGAPDNNERYITMLDTLLHDRPAIGFDVMASRSDPLRYVESSLVGGLKLTSRLGLMAEAKLRNQRTTDTDFLAWVPAHDREVNLTLSDSTIDHNLSLTVGYRKAISSFYTGKIQGEFNRTGPLIFSFSLGVNQFTDLSPELQVGATKDTAQIGLEWNSESPWFGRLTAEAHRFHAQDDRSYLGRGYDFSQEFGYRIRSSYPDWSVRLVSAQGIYSASDNTIESLGVLLPAGVVPSASEFMPENYHQYGVMIGLGSTEANTYSRGWRPFMDVGYVRDSNYGWGPRINVGIGGAVFGSDHLRFFYVHESAGKGNGQRVNQVGLSYRMLF